MSNLLESSSKTVILGYPESGKTTELARRSRGNFFTPIHKNRDNIEIYYRRERFKETYDTCISRFRDFVRTQNHVYADEPFYYTLPFDDLFMLQDIGFDVATHRTAYFMLLEPAIDIVSNLVVRGIEPRDLLLLLRKPSIEFFEHDIQRYTDFLNSFPDIEISDEEKEIFMYNRVLRSTRTTYIVRDALLFYLLYGDSYPEKDIDEYLHRTKAFFDSHSKGICYTYKDVIRRCLEGFE